MTIGRILTSLIPVSWEFNLAGGYDMAGEPNTFNPREGNVFQEEDLGNRKPGLKLFELRSTFYEKEAASYHSPSTAWPAWSPLVMPWSASLAPTLAA